MMWTSTKRIMRSGFFSFWRNGFVSVSSVLVMVITLFVITTTIFLSAILNASLEEIKNKVDINVYFVRTAPEEDILALAKSLESLPEVKTPVEYVSRADALADFRRKHQDDQFTLQALDELGQNPLGASINIRAKEPSQYEGIAEFLKSKNTLSKDGTTLIDKVNYYQNKTAIDTLTKMINSANRLGFIVTLFLVCVSILITFNTIRLAIFMSRDEISVMRLVGASRMYIRGPFVVSGAIYGMVSGFITLILFFPITLWLGNATAEFFVGLNVFSYYITNFAQIFFIVIFSGAFIGALSSFLAVRKHLKI
ncbi:MAG: permease-like cell division protein FtsX [Candidatus Zambryskibacteria bacterium]|nr:permease-like cell division protein FtsX [Candidatus Zambryskibacteria bacterium]